jgi:CRP-like cAMP-binding protein
MKTEPTQHSDKPRDSGLPQACKLVKVTRETILRIPLLSEISEEEVALVLRELRISQFHRREMIIQKGSAPDSLLFLLAGQLQVIDVTESGKEIGLRILHPGDFFGEIAVINGGPRTAYVVALSQVLVAFLPRATALHLFTHSPSIARKLMLLLAEKIQKDSEFRALLSIQNSSKRVCSLLQTLTTRLNSGEQVIERIPTHQEIAIMINTSRETVTRTLLSLAQRGVIQKDSRRLIIRNPAALQQIAQDNS